MVSDLVLVYIDIDIEVFELWAVSGYFVFVLCLHHLWLTKFHLGEMIE